MVSKVQTYFKNQRLKVAVFFIYVSPPDIKRLTKRLNNDNGSTVFTIWYKTQVFLESTRKIFKTIKIFKISKLKEKFLFSNKNKLIKNNL